MEEEGFGLDLGYSVCVSMHVHMCILAGHDSMNKGTEIGIR